jgi:hypothetical protein
VTIYELRQYVLRPDRREVLIDLFDREFVESQEKAGMRVVGQFRDFNNPERFVWIRSFDDMQSRKQALGAFYSGPAWSANRDVANGTMINSDNVLLLRPSDRDADPLPPARPPVGTISVSPAIFTATVHYFDTPVPASFHEFFTSKVVPLLTAGGGQIVKRLQTEYAENTFPQLPVRCGVHAFVCLLRFGDARHYEENNQRLMASDEWNGQVLPVLNGWVSAPLEQFALTPTARSLLR